ncbi:MAG: B12-binding domain-containing radical SAM protein [bacterium]
MKRILLTHPYGPYDLDKGQRNHLDIYESVLTRDQGPFTLNGHTHCYALYLIAENIKAHTTVMEYPYLDDFTKELKNNYDFLGIQIISHTINKVAHMVRLARTIAPQTKIIIGGYGILSLYDPPPAETTADAQLILREVDYICKEEGVHFMRTLLKDEPINRPITQMYLPWSRSFIPGAPMDINKFSYIPILVGLGCRNGCEFCQNSAMFKRKEIKVATVEETFKALKYTRRRSGNQPCCAYIQHDNFLQDIKFVHQLGRLIQKDKEFGLRNLSYFCYADARSLSKYTMEELLELGIEHIWIGVESNFNEVITSEYRLRKRACDDLQSIFRDLETFGIACTASMSLGWDFHTPHNIMDDIDSFIDLKPLFYQIEPLNACPGTKLYQRMKEAGRINPTLTYKDLQHGDVATFFPRNFGLNDLIDYVDLAYKKLFESNGPSIFRRIEINLNGYEMCRSSHRPLLRDEKASFFAERCMEDYPILEVCAMFAPSEAVWERVMRTDERFKRFFGEPTEDQKIRSKLFCRFISERAESKKASPKNLFDPPLRKTFYNPAVGPMPMVKKGREPGPPLPYNVCTNSFSIETSCNNQQF